MLLGFKKIFAPGIVDGSKIFTIRKLRKITPKIGETIYMYSGLRTKHSKLITSDFKYTGCQLVHLHITLLNADSMKVNISVADHDLDPRRYLSPLDKAAFVKHDGFRSLRDFAEYWMKNEAEPRATQLTCTSVIYHWTDKRY
jgi:hypothetical protein